MTVSTGKSSLEDHSTLAWVSFQSSRPSQLLLVVGVYLLGVVIAIADGATFSSMPVLLGTIPLLFLAVSIHCANEYADYETDRLTERTPFSGGSGALPETGVSRTFVLQLAVGSLAVGTVSTLVLFTVGVLPASAVALLAVGTLGGWQYSVGPLQLAWRGWGEVTNAALGGLVLPLYGAAVAGGSLTFVALASIPFFHLVLLNLFATQWPDRSADEVAGKYTLAVLWSARRLRTVYVLIAVAAGVSLVALHSVVLPTAVVLASIPVAPLVVWGAYGYTKRHVPWPTVSAMIGLAVCQFGGWLWLVT